MSVTLHTNLGDLKLELAVEQAPKLCKNFLALCASNYYTNCKFHRNIKGFMIQGGDPSGTGKNGESIDGGLFEGEFVATLTHDRRGILSMAHQGATNTSGSQFFITYARQPHLNGVYPVFGRVIDGMETLDRMEKEPVGKHSRPIKDIVIQNVKIHANPIAEEETI